MRTSIASGVLTLSLGILAACGGSDATTETPGGGNGSSSGGTPAEVPGSEIGKGDGTPESVTLSEMHTLAKTSLGDPEPVDLAFNPADPGQLWVIGYGDDSTHVGFIDGDEGTWKRYRDPAASHFMGKPVAMAMGESPFWGVCGNTDNGQNGPDQTSGTDGTGNLFMGPAMFTTDLTVFAKRVTALGSHYDMLHGTPFCRGIAHVEKNVYWTFNAYDKALDKYDFHKDHGPGNDDHSDGEIYRYATGQVKGADDGTPSHLVYDPTDGMLYVADTGNARVVKLDTKNPGTKKSELPRKNEPLAGSGVMDGVDVAEVIAPGVLEKPSGIEVKGELLYVTDAATSTFHVFKKDGTPVRKLETGLPPGSLAGFTFGPDAKIWFTDKIGGRVMRIDPK